MRFSERSRPRPQRQEEYGDYVERDVGEGWPYADDPGAFGEEVGDAPYGDTGANFDRPRNPGLHDAYDPVAGGGEDEQLGSSPPRRLRGDVPQTRGRHRGKGPRGYTRPDERIREDVSDLLTEEAQLDPSEVEVTVSDGEVTLNGFVLEKFEKRLAEDWADEVLGVTHVQNNIRVRRRG